MNRRVALLVAIVIAVLGWSRAVRADTQVVGGNIINQTWTVAGSPYIVQGDITVPAGSFLTIEAGATVLFASSDGQGSGLDTARVELTVRGTLTVAGTVGTPVVMRAQSGTNANSWYGIVVESTAAAASIVGADVQHAVYGIRSSGTGGVLGVSDTIVQTCGYGVYVEAGSPLLDRVTVRSCTNYGMYVTGAAQPTLVDCVARSNSNNGIYVYTTGGASSNVSLSHCTLHGNGGSGLYVRADASSATAVSVQDSNVTNNSNYGIFRYTSSGSASVNATYDNVWSNSLGNLSGVTEGTGCFSANPLYAGAPTNLRLTANSPSRYAGHDASDLGPLPYFDDPTPALQGTLWTHTTLGVAGSPHVVVGDLTVSPNHTLTLEPGTTLQFATSDQMAAGADTARVELRVLGTLHAVGTGASPVVLTSSGSSANSWYGLLLLTGATQSTVAHATINEAVYGIRQQSSGTHALHHLTLHGSSYGLYADDGTLAVDAVTVYSNTNYGVYVTGSTGGAITNAVVRSNSNNGMYVYTTGGANAQLSISNATVYGNGGSGLYVRADASSSNQVTVRNCVVTNNSNYGVFRYTSSGAASVDLSYSDVWSNSLGNLSGVSAGAGSLATNPLYVGAPSNLALQPTSECIDAGTATLAPDHDRDDVARPLDGNGLLGAEFDMGAYEFVLTPICGDGMVGPGEVCDEGASNGTYGHCLMDCSGMGPHCGDGTTNGPEPCDDGNSSNLDGCLNGCIAASCGDGYVWGGQESCDDGNAVQTDSCLNDCSAASCGDGVVWAGQEECDDGNGSNADGCVAGCLSATCGDGYAWAGQEECDDGNGSNTDGCLNSCVGADCGDGFLWVGVEECDDGNGVDGDDCPNSCQLPACGDGIVHQGEEDCDDGNSSNTDACLNGCIAASCGDGYVWNGVEGCDDGNLVDDDGCRNDCALPNCGDAEVQPPEQCDDGNGSNTDACLNTCMAASCGDGHVQSGVEECDDANGSSADGCVDGCVEASCGDGFVYDGVEACDDGNGSSNDECIDGCLLAACGDGYVESGVEQCDDGNSVDDDGCSNSCHGASCGNAVQEAGEACDDGNASDTDACLVDCRLASCGDSHVQVGVEECDDGNGVSGDGCAPDCMTEGEGGSGPGGGGSGGQEPSTGAGLPGSAGDGAAEQSGGCGCRLEGRGSERGWGALGLLAYAVIAAGRRRGRRGRADH